MRCGRNVEGGGRKQPRKIGITAKPNKTISIVRLRGLRLTYKQVRPRGGGGRPSCSRSHSADVGALTSHGYSRYK